MILIVRLGHWGRCDLTSCIEKKHDKFPKSLSLLIKSFPQQHAYKVPKECLLEFLSFEDYNIITGKSKWHYAMIAAVALKTTKPRKIV